MRLKKISPSFTANNEPIILLLATALVFFILMLRNFGLYSSMSDERTYLLFSQIWPLKDAHIPSYLHLWLFKQTSICGPSFLECARILNEIFFALSVPLIYSICRHFATRPTSLLIATLCALGPTSIFTAYYMPEAMYFFFFWFLVFLFLRTLHLEIKPYILGAFAGVLIALLSLIKIHGIFILLASNVLIFSLLISSKINMKDFAKTIVILNLAYVISRSTVGFVVTNSIDINFMGKSYSNLAQKSLQKNDLWAIVANLLSVLSNHTIYLFSLFALPLAITLQNIFSREQTKASRLFSLLMICNLGVMLLVISYFTASIIGTSPYETVSRLHVRYYSFLFPFFFIITAWHIHSAPTRASETTLKKVSIPITIISFAALFLIHKLPRQWLADAPEFMGIIGYDLFLPLSIVSFISLLLWASEKRIGAKLYLFCVVPTMLIAASLASSDQLKKNSRLDLYNDAGIFISTYLNGKTDSIVLVTSDAAGAFRTMFYLRSYLPIFDLPQGSVVSKEDLENSLPLKNYSWVLLLGDYQLDTDLQNSHYLNRGNYSLVRLPTTSLEVNFKDASWPGIVTQISGFHPTEDFGRWAQKKSSSVEFERPLPANFKLTIVASSLLPNTHATIRVGNTKEEILLSNERKIYEFKINNLQQGVTAINFESDLASPKDIGFNADSRTIGIGIQSITITDMNLAP